MTDPLVARTEDRDYQRLFLQDLHWSAPDHPPVVYDHEGRSVTATNISSYKGLRVWAVNEKPESKIEAELDRLLAQNSTDRIVIFYDDDTQVWRWPARRVTGNSTATRLSRHRHTTGSADPTFAAKLDVIRLPHDRGLNVNEVVAKVREAFDIEAHNETKAASKLMARMYTAMTDAYTGDQTSAAERDHQISATLARLLFLMFGDDTDMWQPNLFRDYIYNHTEQDGSDTGQRLTDLFAHLDTSDTDRGDVPDYLADFPYVNGGIFEDPITLPPSMTAEFRNVMLEACDRDWSAISPAIFGSMFQSVRDPEVRRELGEHYTSEENILKTLDPLFLDDLRAEFTHIKTLGKYEADRLRKLREKLGRIRYMDPACGCGNFIIVAYRELRDLELAIMDRLQEITGDNPMLLANVGLKVSLDHFYGIEIDEWPARIAETAMFLIDRQCDLKLTASLGWAPDRLPIQEQASIVVANATRADWTSLLPPSDDVIIAGNPPFVGQYLKNVDQTADLKAVWGNGYDGYLDYVTAWFKKAADYFADLDHGRFAFVSTNSVAQGQPVPALFRPLFDAGWRIRFAHQTFAWKSEATGAAAVHCVITGFDKYKQATAMLFGYAHLNAKPLPSQVSSINPYLVDGPELFVTKRSNVAGAVSPAIPPANYGSKPTDGGNLIVEADDYDVVAADPIAAQYLHRYIGARELIHDLPRWCLWLEGMEPSDLDRSHTLCDRIQKVREMRLDSTKRATRELAQTPHLFGERRQPKGPYLAIPRHVSEDRRYFTAQRFDTSTICSDANFTAPDADGFFFAIISSSMFLAWQAAVGGRIKSDYRFSNTLVWNTLPLPALDARSHQQIVEAGRGVLAARELHPERSLAEHYNPQSMDVSLLVAHEQLDQIVDKAFHARKPPATMEDRQSTLFARYEEMTAGLLGASTPHRGRRR